MASNEQPEASAAPSDETDAHADTTFNNPSLHAHGALYQAGRQEFQTVNYMFVQGLPTRWTPRALPPLERDVVVRSAELDALRRELAARRTVAIIGEAPLQAFGSPVVARSPALAIQGMAGVGKTILAHLLALTEAASYPDGVIWEEIGKDFTQPAQAQVILRKWADYATDYFEKKRPPSNNNSISSRMPCVTCSPDIPAC